MCEWKCVRGNGSNYGGSSVKPKRKETRKLPAGSKPNSMPSSDDDDRMTFMDVVWLIIAGVVMCFVLHLMCSSCGPQIITPPPQLQQFYFEVAGEPDPLTRCKATNDRCVVASSAYWEYLLGRIAGLEESLDRCNAR